MLSDLSQAARTAWLVLAVAIAVLGGVMYAGADGAGLARAGTASANRPVEVTPQQRAAAMQNDARRATPAAARPVRRRAVPAAVAGTAALVGVAREAVAAPAAAATRGCSARQLIVDVSRDVPILARPGSGAQIGTLPARSKYLGSSMRAWVRQVSPDRRHGFVTLPWQAGGAGGWISLAGLTRSWTDVTVHASLSKRQLEVRRGCRVVLRVASAIGAAASTSPTGAYWVTDPVAVPTSQPQFGSYAFGLSTIQPNLPAGWTGGDQMAIHGTNDPGSIGSAVSAGCLRVSEDTLARLRGLIGTGTPVVIAA